MKTQHSLIAAALVVAIAVVGYGTYRMGKRAGEQTHTAAPMKAGDIDPATGQRVLYWHDPMQPTQKFDRPGKSPFMDMPLVPVTAGSADDAGQVSVSPRVQQNLGMRTAEVKQGTLAASVQAVGSVAYNEREVTLVQARSNGFIEKLHVRAPLDAVRQGQLLAELYVPEWVAAQEEYLSLQRMQLQTGGLRSLVDGARQRMRLAGMSDEQITRIDTLGKVQARVGIAAPNSGVVSELLAREGMTVAVGTPLFRINGVRTMWVNAEVPEAMAPQLRVGQAVQARVSSLPDVAFEGRVGALLPEISASTRTLKARVELANPEGRLVPGMFATLNFAPLARPATLLIPSEAVIETGQRSVVIVTEGDGRFTPVEVVLGPEAGGQTEVRKGLAAGQKVVVSGQFLIDSEASLKGVLSRLGATPASGSAR